MVEFGNYLLNNIVPEWRDKFIEYEELKKIIDSLKIKNPAEDPMDYSSRRILSFYDDIESQENFRKIDSSDVVELLSHDGSDLEDSLLSSHSYYSTSTSSISAGLVVELADPAEQWEDEQGHILFQFMIPKGNGTIVAREQAFYTLLTDNIDMVNTWYIAKLNEYRDKIAKYEKQIEHFCELRRISSMSQSQTYRQLEFGLKELYRMTGYLKNYCMLNKQA
ncbi:hypothetical protein WA171_007175, partial [Blastocystis sp. BT1]